MAKPTTQGTKRPVRVEAVEETPPIRAKDVDTYTAALRYLGERATRGR